MKTISLTKNTTFYTAALTIQRVVSFLYFIYVARAIGVVNQGKFSFAMSFTTIFAMFLDFGLTQILIRESARDKARSQRYLSGVMAFKLLVSVLIYVVVIVTVNIMNYPALTRHLVYVSGIIMLIDSFALSFYGILRGNHNLKFESLGVIINQLIIIIAGVIVLQSKLSMVYFVATYMLGSLFNMLFSLYLLKSKLGLSLKPKFDWPILREIIKLSIPFAIAGIFVRLYSSMDIVLLSKMATDQDVGWYSAAYKVAFALQFVGIASLASIYPAFCAYYVNSKELLAQTFTKIVYYLMILSLPLSVGVIVIADIFVVPVFGPEYANSVAPLQILMLCLPLAFFNFPIGALLNASNNQTYNTVTLGVTAVSNIVLNIILIPTYGYMGSAMAALISYVILFVMGMVRARRVIDYNGQFLLRSFGKIIVSCLAMAAVIFLLKAHLSFIIIIPIGVLVYGGVLYFLRGFVRSDVMQFKLLFKR